jgi:hypothetical protein
MEWLDKEYQDPRNEEISEFTHETGILNASRLSGTNPQAGREWVIGRANRRAYA